ncbi:MAG TPA: histidine kinase, partial [Holophagaceae bacterium]|nr:histidine kinase [Holophagaceae bacterium]
MTGPASGSAPALDPVLGRSLSFRRKKWIAFLVLVALFRLTNGWPHLPLQDGWRLLPRLGHGFGVPALYFAGMTWASAWPWSWTRRSPFWASALIALSFSAGWMVLLAALDVALVRAFGVAVPGAGALYRDQVMFHAPAMAAIGWVLHDHQRLLVRGDQLESASRAAQWSALQSQLHPHALFNAYNALAELMHKDPAAAEIYLRHSADWMRRVLLGADLELHTLREERAMIEDYLAMEGIRLGPRLQVAWDWDESLADAAVPPLTLQPLLENAIKHGLGSSGAEGTLGLRTRRLGPGALVIEVENP